MIQPTLALNFARTGQLDRRVNFSRSSTGVYTGYDGILKYAGINEPRFDYDASANSLGLLIEEQRTNLALYSDSISSWPSSGVSVSSDAIAAPDSISLADHIIESATDDFHRVYRDNVTLSAGQSYALSIYAKAGGRNTLTIYFYNKTLFGSVNHGVNVDLITGDYTVVGSPDHIDVAALNDGWYRVGFSATPTTSGNSGIHAYLNSAASYLGDGTSGIYLWGAQLELGATPSSYIPTTTATVTRTADAAELSGDPFDSWIHTEGTLLAKYKTTGWLYNDTPPTDSLDITKYIDDYSTSAAGDTIERVLFYPRTLTAAQRGRIML